MATILITDDDDDVRSIYRVWLERAGHAVWEAEHGVAALERIATGHPDLLLLDALMPEMDGYVTCERLRAGGHDLPIVMISSLTRPSDVARGLAAGATMYVEKAVSEADLIEVVSIAMAEPSRPRQSAE